MFMIIKKKQSSVEERIIEWLRKVSPMNQLETLLLISCFTFHVKAQNGTDSEPSILKTLHPSLAVVIGVITVMLSLSFLLLAYAKFCQRYPLDIVELQENLQGRLNGSRSGFSGIDQAVINSLPFFLFSSLKGLKEGLECAVCLSKFEETEVLRLLPKCKHAFHRTCVDQWLQGHSSCPLCRYKIDPRDIENFNYSTSLRYSRDPSNLTEEPKLEIFIERDKNRLGPSRRFNVNLGSIFRDRGRTRQELLKEVRNSTKNSRKVLRKFKHKIVVSDVVIKNRWSDVNPSDLLFLSSEMLGDVSSRRLSPHLQSTSEKFPDVDLTVEDTDMERKKLYQSKNINTIERSNSFSSSVGFLSSNTTSYNEINGMSRMINNPAENRSVSEITQVSRFGSGLTMTCTKVPRSYGREERIRRFWLPIARRTVQWLAARESKLPEVKYTRQTSEV